MKKIKPFMLLILVATAFVMCSPDDDTGGTNEEIRDPQVVKEENEAEILEYLQNHYVVIDEESNPYFDVISFEEITDEEEQTPIIEMEELTTKTIEQNNISYEVYMLVFNEGSQETRQPTFADSTLVSFEGRTLRNEIFDSATSPYWLNLPFTIKGFREGFTELRGASSFEENSDGTLSFSDDYGAAAIFIPSALGYYNRPPETSMVLRSYDPLIFTCQLFYSIEADHDNDGIPSYMEDLNETRDVSDVDTDGDDNANFIDNDDDGDGVPTREEIIIEEDGSITFPDSNGNGTPDYLDDTYPEE
ncbi:MAG: FKBP-type peptidyl-prolyl cis-trans isomerase [Bacteroidota bacterium]